jgi:ubiquinone/menaquinone biosynthesis C-methylase UbiE
MIGTDRSHNLITCAKEKDVGSEVFSADSLRLPMRNECVDYVISIAVVHHFSTPQLRIQAITEMKRIIRPNGIILIYVWAMEQERKTFEA